MVSTQVRVVATSMIACGLIACGADSSLNSTETDIEAIRELVSHIQQSFNSGDLDAFLPVFTEDAVIFGQGEPDIVGIEAIREGYEVALSSIAMTASFNTEEIEIAGDLAYERGSYTVIMTDKASGQRLPEIRNRHIHIFQRQPNGEWKTWRMMTNSAESLTAPP